MANNGALMVRDEAGAKLLEQVVVNGDLSKLSPAQRLDYYRRTCESLGLNPLTKPFDYITLNNKLTLYARKDATEQLRNLRGVSISIAARDLHESIGVYAVTARATIKDGRSDEAIGAVNIKGLTGEALANAFMKAETKAKRRVTLSICGLGMLDETEVSTIPDARAVHVDEETGEIINSPSVPVYPSTAAPVPEEKSGSQSSTKSNARSGGSGKPSTEAQHRMIFVTAKKAGVTEDVIKAIMEERYSVDSVKSLTVSQASDLIKYLQETPEPPQQQTIDITPNPADIDFDDSDVPFFDSGEDEK